ncbi:hypothetical protein DFH28DRAFT_1124202 [Melampsora americana]|nr:hypothetical protein DFH28DRAFT_1124202 [Melampsora americana]
MSGDLSNIEAAARITLKLVNIEKSYHEAGGSSNISMVDIRSQFTEVLPFHSKNWYRHWLNFAIRLVRLDKDVGRPVFKNVLPVPTSTPCSDEDKLFIFNVSENPSHPPCLSRPVSPISGGCASGMQLTSNMLPLDSSVPTSEERISNEKGKWERHHKKDDSSNSSSDSSTKLEKNAKKSALLFVAEVEGYDSSISQAVKYFNNLVKPPDFPVVLAKELLLGRFIDIRWIKGELLDSKNG